MGGFVSVRGVVFLWGGRGTYGEPQRVSAIMVVGRDRAKPKSATLRMGTPRGWPRDSSSGDAGVSSRFCVAGD